MVSNVVNPLMVTAYYVGQIAKGSIPSAIATECKGQYNAIRNNLNGVVTMMNVSISEADKNIVAAAGGKLNKVADAAPCVGDWNRPVTGANDTVSNGVNPLMVTAQYVDQLAKETDFERS
jgi:methyl-accepting chemotaxis protein